VKISSVIALLATVGLALSAARVEAQQQSEHWRFRVTPYLVGTSMNGEVAVGSRTAAVDVGFDDILANLEFGAMLHVMASRGPWSVSLDGIYMGLGTSAERTREVGRTERQASAEIDMDQWLVELEAAYQVLPWLEAVVGGRYNLLSADIAFEEPKETASSGNQYWIDPVIGARLTGRLSEDWTLRGRADIGGFGIGSTLTWQLAGYVEYRASDLICILGGYRALASDYENGSGSDQFRYDVTVSGPALGISFTF
jgi:hypothetical protein